jgi:hypothetical protein
VRTWAKLVAFLLTLVVVFLLAAAVGDAVGPIDLGGDEHQDVVPHDDTPDDDTPHSDTSDARTPDSGTPGDDTRIDAPSAGTDAVVPDTTHDDATHPTVVTTAVAGGGG